MQHAVIFRVDGTLEVDRAFDGELPSLQQAVGGYVEIINLDEGMRQRLIKETGESDLDLAGAILCVNEDGRSLGLPINGRISRIVSPYLGNPVPIVGSVLFTVVC